MWPPAAGHRGCIRRPPAYAQRLSWRFHGQMRAGLPGPACAPLSADVMPVVTPFLGSVPCSLHLAERCSALCLAQTPSGRALPLRPGGGRAGGRRGRALLRLPRWGLAAAGPGPGFFLAPGSLRKCVLSAVCLPGQASVAGRMQPGRQQTTAPSFWNLRLILRAMLSQQDKQFRDGMISDQRAGEAKAGIEVRTDGDRVTERRPRTSDLAAEASVLPPHPLGFIPTRLAAGT